MLRIALVALALLCAAPAWAEVVINEIEINPPGDDSAGANEWVELYNPGGAGVDVGGWQIVSGSGKALVLPQGSAVEPGGYATFSHGPVWFANRGDSARLLDGGGQAVDATPRVADVGNDRMTWGRAADGKDTGSPSDWSPGEPTWGASNESPVPVPRRVPVTVSVEAGGPYEAGQQVLISGSVSQPARAGSGAQLPVLLEISGPRGSETARYPDAALGFSVQLQAGGALGLTPGQYTVTARYAGASDSDSFEVSLPGAPEEAAPVQALSVSTDRQSYLPGQDVGVSASAARILPLEGLKISITAPSGQLVESGALFPDRGGGFAASYLVNPIGVEYGTYLVEAEYGAAYASAEYSVLEGARGGGLSMAVSAEAYAPGQTVSLSGSSPKWASSLDVSVERLDGLSRGPLDVSDSVRLGGDGSFSYQIRIPERFEDYGVYRATVSGSVGQFSRDFAVVEDVGSYRPASGQLSLEASRDSYAPGQLLEVSGSTGGLRGGSGVEIDFVSEAGPRIFSRLTALPEAGAFSASYKLNELLFPPGGYFARAHYAGSTAIAPFTVERPAARAPVFASLDKESYGLGETVTLSGTAASSADSAVITLHKPNGDVEKDGAFVDSGEFEWAWEAPSAEIKRQATRSADLSNLGVHRLVVQVGGASAELSFAVSADPGAAPGGLTVSADSDLKPPGSRLGVSGTAPAGGVEPVLVDVLAHGSAQPLLSARAYPGPGGNYSTSFPLPAPVFPDGSYYVRAVHGGDRAADAFDVGRARQISVEMSRPSYAPGELAVAHVTVPPGEQNYSVAVIRESGAGQACGTTLCGEYDLPASSATAGGSFAYSYRVPHSASGAHELVVWSGSRQAHAAFEVEQSERRQESRSRVQDSAAVEVEEGALYLSGSLLSRAEDAASVRLRLEAPGGACIVGSLPGCAQSGPTASPHSEARVIEAGGQKYWLAYSGPGARAELFELGAFGDMPQGQYTAYAEKDGQMSSLYYRVSYAP